VINPGTYRFGLLGVVATEDNTRVTFRLPKNTGLTWTQDGVTYNNDNPELTVPMSRLEVFQIQDKSWSDLTGLRVTADRKIAVFTGMKQINLGRGADDYTLEQMMPTDTWGTRFVLPIVPGKSEIAYKLITKENTTTINVLGSPLWEAGNFVTEAIRTNQDTYIESDKPIMVGLFIPSFESAAGGPAMIIVPPVKNYESEYFFTVPDGLGWTARLQLTANSGDEDNIWLDGSRAGGWGRVPGSSMIATSVALLSGYHYVYHDREGRFGAFVTAESGSDSCQVAFTVGQCLQPVSRQRFLYNHCFCHGVCSSVNISLYPSCMLK
jgi:hypothetical protein